MDGKDVLEKKEYSSETPEWMNILKKAIKEVPLDNLRNSSGKEVLKNNPKMNKSKQEKGIKFWKKWLNADLVKREKMVGNLPIMKSIWALEGISNKTRKQILTIMINRFFEDLETQIYLDKE